MKRILVLLTVLAMMVTFAACGTIETEDTGSGGNDPFVPTLDLGGSDHSDDGIKPVEFEQIVVFDNEYCTLKLTGVEDDVIWGYTITAYLENKSPDKTYMFSAQDASVNGVKVIPLFASEVAPGKKANETITFTEDVLSDNNVGRYTDIQIDFRVYDSNDWSADDVATASAHIYPYGQENAVAFVRESKAEDIVLVDNDKVSVTAIGFRTDEIWGYCVDLYVVNKTDVSIMVTLDECSVNGFMVDPFFAASVPAGRCAFETISWSDSDLEENSITAVESIEFKLRVYNETDFLADDLVNEVVTLKP